MKSLYFLIAFIAGCASSFQGLFNGYWQQRLDLKTVLLVNATVVMVGAVIYYLIMVAREGNKSGYDSMTPAIIVGGLCGLVIIAAMALVFPKIGPLNAITLFVAGQIAAALFITYFGILGSMGSLEPTKIIGAFVTLVGVYLVLR